MNPRGSGAIRVARRPLDLILLELIQESHERSADALIREFLKLRQITARKRRSALLKPVNWGFGAWKFPGAWRLELGA